MGNVRDGGCRLGWGAGVAPNRKLTIYALISGLVGKTFEDLKSSRAKVGGQSESWERRTCP